MTSQTVQLSPQLYVRICGALYLVIILVGLYGEVFVRSHLIAAGDPTATASKVVASQLLFRGWIAGDLLMHVCDIPLTLILYALLRPVSPGPSALAALFSLVQTAILAPTN